MIEYEPQDLKRAIELYQKGYVLNEPTEENIIDCARAYYIVRQRAWLEE